MKTKPEIPQQPGTPEKQPRVPEQPIQPKQPEIGPEKDPPMTPEPAEMPSQKNRN